MLADYRQRVSLLSLPFDLNEWPRQESNLNLELRKLLYYPLYYEAKRKTFPTVNGNRRVISGSGKTTLK